MKVEEYNDKLDALWQKHRHDNDPAMLQAKVSHVNIDAIRYILSRLEASDGG